jgi:lipopolysaccharide biosynthesis glycosyltransferase
MRTIPILFTFDEKLIIPAGVCITSLLENAYPDTFYDIFILHSPDCNLEDSILTRLQDRYPHSRFTFRQVENEFRGAYEIRGIPETAYYRLVSPELIPEYEKFLYSDVDVIFREDLGKYYDIELGDHYFAAVDNGVRLRPSVQKYVSSLGLDPTNGYFYSGNLVINAALQREDHMADRFRECAKNDYYDQDMAIINIVCNKRILPLGPAYCLSNFLYKLIVTRRDEMVEIYGEDEILHALKCGIVHYNGAKPWKRSCMNMDIWWFYYRKSPFFNENFCFDFWEDQTFLLERTSLTKRLKMVARYPIDKKQREL